MTTDTIEKLARAIGKLNEASNGGEMQTQDARQAIMELAEDFGATDDDAERILMGAEHQLDRDRAERIKANSGGALPNGDPQDAPDKFETL